MTEWNNMLSGIAVCALCMGVVPIDTISLMVHQTWPSRVKDQVFSEHRAQSTWRSNLGHLIPIQSTILLKSCQHPHLGSAKVQIRFGGDTMGFRVVVGEIHSSYRNGVIRLVKLPVKYR